MQYRAVAMPVGGLSPAARAEDTIDVRDPGHRNIDHGRRVPAQQGAIVGLLVLPPADVADEALVVEQQTLATQRHVERRLLPLEHGPVQFRIDRVGDDRPQCLTICRTVVGLGIERPNVIHLNAELPALAGRAHPGEACSQGRCGRVLCKCGIVNRLDARSPLQRGRARESGRGCVCSQGCGVREHGQDDCKGNGPHQSSPGGDMPSRSVPSAR